MEYLVKFYTYGMVFGSQAKINELHLKILKGGFL